MNSYYQFCVKQNSCVGSVSFVVQLEHNHYSRNTVDLLKVVPGLSSETGAAFSVNGRGINRVKVEVTDVQKEEEVPMPISF
jgi:hypothetical protein